MAKSEFGSSDLFLRMCYRGSLACDVGEGVGSGGLVKPRAATLVEVLVVVLITSILAGLLLPVFKQARTEGYRASALGVLRQTWLATSLYRENSGGDPPAGLQSLVESGLLKEPRFLLLPGDPYSEGYARRMGECGNYGVSGRLTFASSVEAIFALDEHGRQPLLETVTAFDTNPGWYVVRIYGDRETNPGGCSLGEWYGPRLRVNADGSVRRSSYIDKDPRGYRRTCTAGLFTDVDPKLLCPIR
jgi:type II secretory pathway pseudopilin PulG